MFNKSISIRHIILIVFIILMLTTVGGISHLVFSNWRDSVAVTVTERAEDMNSNILYRVNAFVQGPLLLNEANQGLIKNGIVDMNDAVAREKFFVGVLKTQSADIYSFSYGAKNGDYYGARRNSKGVMEIMRNNAATGGNSWYYAVVGDATAGDLAVRAGKFDPRTRNWYQAAQAARNPVFSPIYKHFVMDDLTVSAAYPIYNQAGELQGVLGTHIILSNIDNFLKDIVHDTNGLAVICEQGGALIASSFDMQKFKTVEGGAVQRLTLADTNNPTLLRALTHFHNTGEKHFVLSVDGDRLHFQSTEFRKNGLDWIVMSAIPENPLMAGVTASMKLTWMFVVLAVILSIVIYFMLTHKLLKPIEDLIVVTEEFSRGNLSQRAQVVRNDEIGRISHAFNNMADTIYKLVFNLEETVKERTAQHEAANNALEASKDQLRLILDSTAEAIYGIDLNGNCTFCNASCIKILGYNSQEELLGQNMHWKIHHSHRDGAVFPLEECKIFRAFMDGKGTHVDDEVLWRADGTYFEAEYFSYPQYKNGEIVGAVITFMDIRERKQADEEIRYLSYHDALTGLYNRMFYEEELKRMDTAKNLPISMIVGDVNGLKLTNDIFGHAAGDELLVKVAETLKAVCRTDDVVARVGGDEFVVLLPRTTAEDAAKVMTRIKNMLSTGQVTAIRGSLSMGVDTKLRVDQDIMDIMKDAEDKMYLDKTINRKSINASQIQKIIETLHRRSPAEEKHSYAVSDLCQKIGKAMGLQDEEIKRLKDAAFVHDIGKVVMDDKMINSEAALTEQEEKDLQTHTVVGFRILNSFDDMMDLADSVLAHHEMWDGSGYPKQLKGEEIPKLARILAVAEAYAEMIQGIDQEASSKEEALLEIKKQAGKKFDPHIVEAFIYMMQGEFGT
ncbi:MAG: diguanylate cyclase [Negativicutes bacterium]